MRIYEVKDINLKYGNGSNSVDALKDINLSIDKGEIIAITGTSGSGKSTLLNVMSGLDKPSSGSVFFNGEDITKLSQKKLSLLRLKNFGFVFQMFHLVPTMTVYDNICLPVLMDGKTVDKSFFEKIVETFSIDKRLNHMPHQLSGGEQQRVAIARAIINKPTIVFADEPTGNLDSLNGNKVFGLILHCAKDFEQTLIYVTHDQKIAESADRVVALRDGVIV